MSIRSHTALVGVFPTVPYMRTTLLYTLSPSSIRFAGRFTLPFEVTWGAMILAEGEYSLYYGTLHEGMSYVEIHGMERCGPKGIFLIEQQCPATVVQNSLVCVRKGSRHIIRALELPAVGRSITFAIPIASDPTSALKTKGEPYSGGVVV